MIFAFLDYYYYYYYYYRRRRGYKSQNGICTHDWEVPYSLATARSSAGDHSLGRQGHFGQARTGMTDNGSSIFSINKKEKTSCVLDVRCRKRGAGAHQRSGS
jgi:hypothetical protein